MKVVFDFQSKFCIYTKSWWLRNHFLVFFQSVHLVHLKFLVKSFEFHEKQQIWNISLQHRKLSLHSFPRMHRFVLFELFFHLFLLNFSAMILSQLFFKIVRIHAYGVFLWYKSLRNKNRFCLCFICNLRIGSLRQQIRGFQIIKHLISMTQIEKFG